MQNIVVDKKYDGKQLSKFLQDKFDGLTIDNFYKALRKKNIRINNVRTSKNDIVHTGDEIKIFIIDELLYKGFSPEIIYEDNNILVVNKPFQMEVLGEISLTSNLRKFMYERDFYKDNIVPCNPNVNKTEKVCNDFFFLEPCHRLDRNTTGLVLFAKNKKSLDILLEKFKNKEIEKHYTAKVYGIPKVDKQTLYAYLFKDNKKSLVYISDEPKKGYVKIVTSYNVLEKHIKENYSVLDVTLHTGRTHQIRAHLAHIGYPILGDGKYGNNKINKEFGYKTQQLCSYIIKFNFTTDAGILNYLNNKTINL